MANSVDAVIGSEAIKQVENLIAKLTQADAELIKISQSAIGASKGISSISTPSGLDKSVSNVTALNSQLEKQNAIINKLHADISKKAEQSRLAEIRLQQQREKAFDVFERNAKKEADLNAKNETSYQRIQNSVNVLTKTYQDLAIRKQLGNTLTAKEEVQLTTLTQRISKYQSALLTVDSQIGKNQRNVGNYSGSFNALGNSINQLSREAPAFANSLNTGFMAISNNLPALFDAIKGINTQNKALASEGKPTVGVLKQLAGALFSWQTLLSVGVTLLTIYGGKIVEFLGSALKGKEAIKSLAENQSLLNNSLKESSGSYAEEKVNIDVLYKSATDLNRSYKDRKRDVDELQQLYPFYFKSLTDEEIMVGKAKDQYNLLSQAIITTAKARASEEILQKRESERLVIEQKDIEEITKKYADLNRAKSEKTTSTSVGVGGVSTVIGKESIRRDIQKLREESILQRAQWAKEDAFFISKIAEGNVIEQTLKPAEKAKKISTKIEDDRLKAIAEARKKELELELANIDVKLNNEDSYYSDRLVALDYDFLKRVEIAKVDYDEEFRLSKGNQDKQKTALINFQLEKIKLIESYNKQKNTLEALDLDPITKMATSKSQEKEPFNAVIESGKKVDKTLEQIGKRAEDTQKRILELGQETTQWLASFGSEFLQNSGLGSLETFFDGTFNKLLEGATTTEEKFAVTFNAIAESAQEAFNFISNASQANFDAEYSRLESQKEIALTFAGDSASAREKIEADSEKKKKQIAEREFKAKQKQAIFNIAIDTAQAIVSTYAQVPKFDFGVSATTLALIIGGIGLAQAGVVASQKVPQYFDGTDNHIGGMMLVNDGAGSNFQEKVILPNGKEIMPEGRNVLMNAPKGTKVLTHEQQIMQMLNERGISMSANYNKNNGMTAQEMDSVMAKHFSKIQTNVTNIDQNGIRTWSESNGNKTIRNNNRVSRTGYSV